MKRQKTVKQPMKKLSCGCRTGNPVRVGATTFCGWHGWVEAVRA